MENEKRRRKTDKLKKIRLETHAFLLALSFNKKETSTLVCLLSYPSG